MLNKRKEKLTFLRLLCFSSTETIGGQISTRAGVFRESCALVLKKNRQWEIYFGLLLSANTKFSEQSSKKLASSRLSALRLNN